MQLGFPRKEPEMSQGSDVGLIPIAYGQKNYPARCPEQELIALCTLVTNQAREIFCDGSFPASLIYVLIESRCPVDFYAASVSQYFSRPPSR
jgi:hypothetical protein